MKRRLALPILLALVIRLSAQLPIGSVVPDFTAQDITGQTWHLYELLEQGKTVVLEVSATWCPPCWAYHNSHALQQFHEAHGPDGDNKAQVLFIEGDPATNTECLFDKPGCNDFTPGDWVAGTTYPYLDNSDIADTLQVDYYPTIYIVCPNKKVYQIGQLNAGKLWEKVSGCPVAAGVNNAGIFNYTTGSELRDVCDTLDIGPQFTLVNLGSDPLTAATFTLQWNNNLEQTKQWYGNLPLYGEAAIQFDSLPLGGEGVLKTTLTSVNNAPSDDDFSNNVFNDNYADAESFKTKQIILKIKTDNFGAETYWEIRDDRDSAIFHGGNEAVGPDGGGTFVGISGGPGAYGNNILITKLLKLPSDGCYSIFFVDAYGDGICCGYGNGYFKLYNSNNPTLPILSGAEFEANAHHGFRVSSTSTTDAFPKYITDLRLFPSPATDRVNIEFALTQSADVSITVANALSQSVYRLEREQFMPGEHEHSLSVKDWANGVYFVRLQADGQTITRKFAVGGN